MSTQPGHREPAPGDWRMSIVLVAGALCACWQMAGSRGQVPLPPLPSGVPVSPALLYPYLVVPAIVLGVIGEHPFGYLIPGRWRQARGPVVFAIAVPALVWILVGLWPVTGASQSPTRFVVELSATLLCVEFFYRGFLLLPLVPRFGRLAIGVATLPYALSHAGKPAWELFGSIAYGLVAGHLAMRTGSVVYGWGMHVLLAAIGAIAAWP